MGVERRSLCWAAWDPDKPAKIAEIASSTFSTSRIALSGMSGDLIVPMNNEVFSFNPATTIQTSILRMDEDLCIGNLWVSPDGAELILATHRQTPSRKEMVARVLEQRKVNPASTDFGKQTIVSSDFRLWSTPTDSPKPQEILKIPGQLAYGDVDWKNRSVVGSVYPDNRFFRLDLSTGAIKWTSVANMHDIALSPDGRAFAWSPWAPGIFELLFDAEARNLYPEAAAPAFSPNGCWAYFNGPVLQLADRQARSESIVSLKIENNSNLYLRRWCLCGDHLLVFNNQAAPGEIGVALDIRKRQLMALPDDFSCSGTWYSRKMLHATPPRKGAGVV
jgi:hypothetical protein